jgi:putative endonuclease
MQFVVYILFSSTHNKNYVGYTTDLINRMKSHNMLGNDWTKKFRPWHVVYLEFYNLKKDAMAREKYFKSGRGLYFKKQIISDFLIQS